MTYKNPRLKHVKKIEDIAMSVGHWSPSVRSVAKQILYQCNLLLETKKGKKLKKVSEGIVSICCKAPVYVKGNVTMNYVCSKCDKACDVTVLSTYSPLLTCKEASEKLLEATRGIPSQTETKKKKKCLHNDTKLVFERGGGYLGEFCKTCKKYVSRPEPSPQPEKCDLHRTLDCPYCFAPQPEINKKTVWINTIQEVAENPSKWLALPELWRNDKYACVYNADGEKVVIKINKEK